ncbi:MAG: alpha-1,4-glucan--maltose-1-phosphate maltosyltransferase [Myxococcota bacterium]
MKPLSPARPIIVEVSPQVDAGRFEAKRVLGERVRVTARVICDGHDRLAGTLRFRRESDDGWSERALTPLGNDLFEAAFTAAELGAWRFQVHAWIDRFATAREELRIKHEAGEKVASELLEIASLVRGAAQRTTSADTAWLDAQAETISGARPEVERVRCALSDELLAFVARHPDRSLGAESAALPLRVERERAASGAWYEMFPRSCATEAGRHGTFRDCEARLEYVASMGFDVVYLPPIHPIGVSNRKGRNGARAAAPGDPGSPWAIGADEGGHKAVHPELGSLADFDRLVARARSLGLEIALDIAFQCSPDHPYVRKHPEWFRWRGDGTIQYAENPPKKYQDIYPLNFESERWRELFDELLSVFLFWIDHGVTIFRVDNPHTKPFAFWEWVIAEVRRRSPETVFLSEAFTRPTVLKHLAKLGFSQSYTYFTWRNTKRELVGYLTELLRGDAREYLRPNLFANTPDILHEYLQIGGRAGFQLRAALAATLSATYGIYGPPFELCVGAAVPGTEEYLDSEKYQIRHWNLDDPDTLRDFLARLNEIRRQNPALGAHGVLRFLEIDNEQLIAYARTTPDLSDAVIVVVNLSPHHAQSGWLELPLDDLGIDPDLPFQADDLLGGARYLWHGARNYVELDPAVVPAHVFRLRRKLKTERDFDYFL